MNNFQVIPGETLPQNVKDCIKGILLPYPAAWDRIYKAITSPEHIVSETTPMPNPSPNMAERSKLLSTEEIGELLHVSRVTIFRYMKAGKIRAYKLGRRNLFSLNEVMASLKNEEVANV